MQIRTTVSTNIPADPDRKTRAAVRAACAAGAKEHHDRHIPRHDQNFATPKYGYAKRGDEYRALKRALGIDDRPLHYSGRTMAELMSSYTITVTGTRGARLAMKTSLGIDSGRIKDAAAILRLIDAAKTQGERLKLLRFLKRLNKQIRLHGVAMTGTQKKALMRHAEITAVSSDELKHIAKTEEATFAAAINKREPMRKL